MLLCCKHSGMKPKEYLSFYLCCFKWQTSLAANYISWSIHVHGLSDLRKNCEPQSLFVVWLMCSPCLYLAKDHLWGKRGITLYLEWTNEANRTVNPLRRKSHIKKRIQWQLSLMKKTFPLLVQIVLRQKVKIMRLKSCEMNAMSVNTSKMSKLYKSQIIS